MFQLRHKIGFVLCALMLTHSATAQDKQAKVEMQSQIESRVLTILKGFDELAIVFANVKFDKTERRLPATPFVIQDTKLNKNFQVEVSSIEVSIYTKLQPVPPELNGLIKEAVAEFKVEPQLTFKPLPAKYGDNLIKKDDKSGVDQQVAQGEVPKIDINLDSIKNAIDTQGEKLQLLVFSVGAISGVMMLVTLLGLFSLGRNRKIIEAGLKQVSASVENSAAAAGGGGNVIDMPREERARSTQQALPAGDSESFKNFEVETVVALLMDCYWGSYDTFAAYIWKRIPVAKRADVLNSRPGLEEYVHFLSGMDEQNLGFEQDPYYLNPLPIHHLDNHALTEEVRKNPGLIAKIPNMRVDCLDLEVKERLQLLSMQGRFEEFQMPDFNQHKESEPRVLKKHIKFNLKSIEEEEEILALENLDPFVCRDIPTLGFLVNADEEKVKGLLEGFSAQELAQAWIGPEAVLNTLSSYLPEKKFKLVEAYLEKIKPSRQSRPFQVLHFRANLICFPEKSDEDMGEQLEAS